MQVITATFTHKHGSDTRVFVDAAGAEAWRQAIAAEGWEGFMNEDAPVDSAEKADRYFQRGNELGDESFEIYATELEGFAAPAVAEIPAIDWRAIARDLAGALSACTDQIEQMNGMFKDRDGAVSRAIADADDARKAYWTASTASPAEPAPATRTIWTCTFEGDNYPMEVTVHQTEAEALQRVRDDLRSTCRPWQLSHLNAMPADSLPQAWEEKHDGTCMIESHEIPSTPASA